MASLACLWAEPVPETERSLSRPVEGEHKCMWAAQRLPCPPRPSPGGGSQTSEDKRTSRPCGNGNIKAQPREEECQSVSLLPTSRRGGGSEVLFQTVPGPEGGF